MDMTTPFDLSGQTAIVTGANTGIGQAIALSLAAAGADIAAVGRTPAQDTVEKVRALGRQAQIVSADLSSICLLYTSPSPRDKRQSRMPSSA